MIAAALAVFGVAVFLWLAWEIRRAPLCCNRCEMPVDQCCCHLPYSQNTKTSDGE